MLRFYTGTDAAALRKKLNAILDSEGAPVLRVTDAHTLADLEAALGGGGLFSERKSVVLDSVLSREDMHETVLARLPLLRDAEEQIFLYDGGAADAATRKMIEKHADTVERADLPKKAKQESVFALANALQRGQKKELWVGYQREIAAGKAPEAIHGVLFWAAKQLCLRTPNDRARGLVAALAEFPHEARRRGEELEYALERFVLSKT